MSSFITAGPTVRRLLYSAGRRASELQRQRGYAQVIQPRKRTKPSSQKPPISQSPRSQRRQQPGALSADSSSRSEPRQIFQESDVPKEEEWELALTAFGNKDLTAHLCRTAALVYVNLATQHEEQWRNTLESGKFSFSLSIPPFQHTGNSILQILRPKFTPLQNTNSLPISSIGWE